MTMINAEYSEETYYLSLNEYNDICDMFDNNKLIDHCTFYDNNGTICLIAHGSQTKHKVWFNDEWRTSKELSQLIREELSIPTETEIMVRIFCCHGAYIGGYRDNKTLIISAFYNKPVLNLTYSGYIVAGTTALMAKFAYVD